MEDLLIQLFKSVNIAILERDVNKVFIAQKTFHSGAFKDAKSTSQIFCFLDQHPEMERKRFIIGEFLKTISKKSKEFYDQEFKILEMKLLPKIEI